MKNAIAGQDVLCAMPGAENLVVPKSFGRETAETKT